MFWRSFSVTLERLFIGVPISLALTMAAYPVKDEHTFHARENIYVAVYVCHDFNAGLVPTYLLIKDLNMMDTIWALVLPTGVNVFNIVLMMNFSAVFRRKSRNRRWWTARDSIQYSADVSASRKAVHSNHNAVFLYGTLEFLDGWPDLYEQCTKLSLQEPL